jgi:4-hydroxybenzoate polyprenyltransferase
MVREDAAVRLPAIIRAAHPLPAAAVTAFAGAVVAGRGADPVPVTLAVASTAAGQLSVGWGNDYLDREEDARAGREDKPVVVGEVAARTLGVGAVAAVILCLGLAAPLGLGPAAAMGAAVGSAWAYNLGLQRTWLSWLPYATSFGLAPVFLWLVSDGVLPPLWVVAGAALLGVAGHLTNVLPDLESDRAGGARGLPHRLGAGWSLLLACSALGATLALVLAFGDPRGWVAGPGAVAGAACIAAVAVAGIRGHLRAAFALTIVAAGVVVATFVLSSP